MRLLNTETGQWTRVKKNQFGFLDFSGAADRLVGRYMPGYFAVRASAGWDDLPDEFEAEICRGLGDLTEHTGEKIYLKKF
ncbi:MAG: hypothetical protein ACHQYP_05880 [Nitrospiria bacterium]